MTARMLAWKQPFIQRVRNSSLVEGLGVDNNRSQRRRFAVRRSGASGKANVGISNDKGGVKPPRRKTKVS